MYLLISFYSSLQIPRLVTNETNGGRCRSVVEARRKERPPSFEGAPQGQRGCLDPMRKDDTQNHEAFHILHLDHVGLYFGVREVVDCATCSY